MPDVAFHLVAEVSSQSPEAIESLLIDLVDGSVTPTKDGFHVEGWMRGPDARELNRFLLSALRRVERRTRLRAEWTGEGETHRFFDYVPKGTRLAEASQPTGEEGFTAPELMTYPAARDSARSFVPERAPFCSVVCILRRPASLRKLEASGELCALWPL